MHERNTVIEAIRTCGARETSADPELWTQENRAKGHCDVSSFEAWEFLGGDLVLSHVLIDGELSEYHYWNRIDGQDLDLTREQFFGHEEIAEVTIVADAELQTRQAELKPDVRLRIEQFRRAAHAQLAAPSILRSFVDVRAIAHYRIGQGRG